MASIFDTTRNFSLYTIPVAWVIALAPHFCAITQSKAFDNCSPRTYAKSLEKDQTIDNAKKDQILRLEAAQSNGFENLPFFACGVLAGNLAGLPAETLNILSGGYLLSRVAYNMIYATNTTEAMANARTGVFLTGVGLVFTLFIKSGNVLRERAANLL